MADKEIWNICSPNDSNRGYSVGDILISNHNQFPKMTNTKFITAISAKLKEIDNPDPDIITHISYQWKQQTMKRFGTIPKLTFTPYGQSTRIKAEIKRSEGPIDKDLQKDIDEIRQKYSPKIAKDKEDRILGRRFEVQWNSYWKTIRKALNRIEQAQKAFAKPDESVSVPMKILLGKRLIPAKTKDAKDNQKSNSYIDELMEVDMSENRKI